MTREAHKRSIVKIAIVAQRSAICSNTSQILQISLKHVSLLKPMKLCTFNVDNIQKYKQNDKQNKCAK